MQNTSAEGTRTGTRASVFYLNEFYDNVFIRLRGGYTTHGRKFEFNDGHHFSFDPNLPRVDEFNLNERGADSTYMRQVLAWETYVNASQPGCLAFPMHVRRNGSYVDVRIFIEQPDRDLLRRTGLDPDGALYKMYDDLQNGQIDGEGIHRKKTRLNEDAGDLLVTALRETREEVGIASSSVDVLGALPSAHTVVTGILIVPFVGALLTRPAITPNPEEIADVFDVSLRRLVEVEAEVMLTRDGRTHQTFAYDLGMNLIWGATGRILHSFLRIVEGLGLPTT